MLSNFFKTTLRSFWKNKVFVLFNILGLAIAIACSIVAFLNWDYNAKFDTVHENAESIYRINFIRQMSGREIANGSCPLPLGAQIKGSISQIDEVIRVSPSGGNFRVDNELFGASMTAVDPNFFEVFTFDILHGDASALKDKSAIVISEVLRERHFPEIENPVGEIMTYVSDDERIDFRIAGVFAEPVQNQSFYSESYVRYDNIFDIDNFDEDNWQRFNTTFITVPSPDDLGPIEDQLQQFVEIQNKAKEDYKVHRYYLDPFVGMAVRAEREDVWNHWFQWSLPTAAAIAPAIMAGLLLLLACFNFMNTSIAIANRRIKEIGVRKVLGSSRKQLIYQFLGENILLTFIALLVGLGIAAYLVPAYSAMWGFLDIELNPADNPELIFFLGLLLLFTGCVAGSYPAFYVSGFEPTVIFRRNIKLRGSNLLTRILLTLQFSISLIAIICGFMFAHNAQYQANYDLGFEFNSALSVYVKDQAGYNAMRNELASIPQIEEMAGSGGSAARSWYTDPVRIETQEFDVNMLDVGHGYLQTIGANIIAGRDFAANSAADEATGVIVNQEFVRTAGWDEPLGQRIVLRDSIQLNVVGVVQDIYIDGGLWNPIDPLMMRFVREDKYRFLTVRTDPTQIGQVKKAMDDKWAVVFPDELSTVQAMDNEWAQTSEVNRNIKLMFLFLGIVAVLLSIFGLYSLVSLNINKRMKEMGVRKVLGASVGHIAFRISREFIVIIVIAIVLGTAAGYYLSDALMDSIWAYHVTPSIVAYVLSIAVLVAVSVATISGKIFTSATVNPSEILRSE